MSLPILYSFRRCPYAMRARMGLLVAGIHVELREIVLRDKPADMLTASPKGTVPVLCLDDGRVIDESLDIMLWALEQNDPDGWLEIDRVQQVSLIEECQANFKPHLDRYKYTSRYEDAEKVEEAGKALNWLAGLSDQLGDKHWLFSDSVQMADIAIFPFVRQFAHTDMAYFEAETDPALQDWLGRAKELPVFRDSFRKYTPWQPGDNPLHFGR